MTWKIFANTICEAKIENDIACRIIQKLFSEAGSRKEFAEETAKAWINGERNCAVNRYFPAYAKMDYNRIFRFFRNRPIEKLKNLQELFRSTKESGDAVDVNTDDVDTFCLSLVNQFLDLLRRQRIDASYIEALSKSEDVSSDADSEQLLESSGDLTTIGDVNIPRVGKHTIRSMLLPHSEECCYHCEYWIGDRTHLGAYREATYGRCIKYNNPRQLSSDLPCKDFKKHPKSPLEW